MSKFNESEKLIAVSLVNTGQNVSKGRVFLKQDRIFESVRLIGWSPFKSDLLDGVHEIQAYWMESLYVNLLRWSPFKSGSLEGYVVF